MSWMKRLALCMAPYYFQPLDGPRGSRIRYEGLLLLSKQGEEWKVMIDVEKQRMLQSLWGGYRVIIDRDPDFESPEGAIELETQRRIVDNAMPMGEEATHLLEDHGYIGQDVLAGIYWCFKRYSDRCMPVKQPNNRLCI